MGTVRRARHRAAEHHRRALNALGEEILTGTKRVVLHNYGTALARREERTALELHRAVAKKLVDESAAVLAVVPQNIERLRGQVQGESANSWLDEWSELAQLGSVKC